MSYLSTQIVRTVLWDAMTLYMLCILIRWVGPYLDVNIQHGRLRFITAAVDPLIQRLRRLLPSMGPMDFGPLAALLLVWLMREIFVGAMPPVR